MTLQESILDLSRQARLGPLSPWLAQRFDEQVARGLFLPEADLETAGTRLVEDLKDYRQQAGVGTAVLGMSGGVDSALTAALLKRAGWRVIGFTLPIEQAPEETERGIEACRALDVEHHHLDLSEQYRGMVGALGTLDPAVAAKDEPALRIRRGNVRARLRMVTLYDQAHRFGGVVASTDNFSELGAGFWTLHGDVGDLSPVQAMLKSWEVPWLARAYGVPESTWRATPTDGLGISAGDEAQIGATYLEWDIMVFAIMDAMFAEPALDAAGLPQRLGLGPGGDERARLVFDNVMARLGGTWFKRVNPIILSHPLADRLGPLETLDARLFQPRVLRPEERWFRHPADVEALATALVERCKGSGDRLVTAESCTAGLLGSALAAAPGSSDVVSGAFVTYRTAMKSDALGVPRERIAEVTPYHPDIALAMARGALERAPEAGIALAVTGVGGPEPQCGKPPGLVCVAVVRRDGSERVEEHRFPGSPKAVMAAALRAALVLAGAHPDG